MNKIIKIGIWEVNDVGLVARISPKGFDDYSIQKEELWKKRDYNGKQVWDWLIHLTEKDYVDLSNVNDLNVAFFFAQDYHKSYNTRDVDYTSNAQTIFIQRQLLEIKEKFAGSNTGKPIALSEARETESFKEYKKAKANIKVLDID